jgi:hypothetical protein
MSITIVTNPNGTIRRTVGRKTEVLAGNIIRTYTRSRFSHELEPPRERVFSTSEQAAYFFGD